MDEDERLAQMYLRIDPDAPLDEEIQRMVAKASEIAGVPKATLNLLDGKYQCNLGAVGFEGSVTAREDAMCNVTLEEGAFVAVVDAHEDPRFVHNPWVDGRIANVSFYASMPLLTRDNYAIGTLCVFDDKPKDLTAVQVLRLLALASEIVVALERQRNVQLPPVRNISLAQLLRGTTDGQGTVG